MPTMAIGDCITSSERARQIEREKEPKMEDALVALEPTSAYQPQVSLKSLEQREDKVERKREHQVHGPEFSLA